jgi:hypothetical protein
VFPGNRTVMPFSVFLAAVPLNGVITFNCSLGKKSKIEDIEMNEMRRNDDQSELLQFVP